MRKLLLGCAVAMGALFAGCGAEGDLEAEPSAGAAMEQPAPIDAYLQPANGAGECCSGYCAIATGHLYRYGNKEKTSGCTEYMQDVCARRGMVLRDADWISCSTGNMIWL
jgi:hypothetical protein